MQGFPLRFAPVELCLQLVGSTAVLLGMRLSYRQLGLQPCGADCPLAIGAGFQDEPGRDGDDQDKAYCEGSLQSHEV